MTASTSAALPIGLLSSDLDGTLIGDRAASERFASAWTGLPDGRRPLLCYNSGRLINDMRAVCPTVGLPQPDLWIGGVGTELACDTRPELAAQFQARFDDGWDRPTVQRIVAHQCANATAQPSDFQETYKSSWFLSNASSEQLADLQAALTAAGLKTTIVYSSDRDLDVLPALANKGNALAFACEAFGLTPDQAVVAGDTGNDASMFILAGTKGIVMAEAGHELLQAVSQVPHFRARCPIADGVIEGLRHYGVLP